MLTLFIPGVNISGGFPAYIIGGAVLSIMFMTLKPVLSLITLPLNFVTLGTFSFLVNVIILYLFTLVVSNISISAFTFSRLEYAGFIIPELHVNQLFAFLIASFLLSVIFTFLSWLIKR
jgi:uncharacterized membrane protein YvlD (DUF360 family)